MEPFIPKSIRSAPKIPKFNRGRPQQEVKLQKLPLTTKMTMKRGAIPAKQFCMSLSTGSRTISWSLSGLYGCLGSFSTKNKFSSVLGACNLVPKLRSINLVVSKPLSFTPMKGEELHIGL